METNNAATITTHREYMLAHDNHARKALVENTEANLVNNWRRYLDWCDEGTVPSMAHFAYCVDMSRFLLS